MNRWALIATLSGAASLAYETGQTHAATTAIPRSASH